MISKNTKIVVLFFVCIGMGSINAYEKTSDQGRAIAAQDIAVFFKYAQKMLPKLELEITRLKNENSDNKSEIEDLESNLEVMKVVDALMNGDAKFFQNSTCICYGNIWVDNSCFSAGQGAIESRMLAAENALGFALCYSVMAQSPQDQEKALAFITMLLDKVPVDSKINLVLWAKDSEGRLLDYVAMFTLVEFAELYCSEQVETLLKQYVK